VALVASVAEVLAAVALVEAGNLSKIAIFKFKSQ
jgi:hypothetical protein